MNSERCITGPGHMVVPPYSTRTLHHPSFLPLYMAAASAHRHGLSASPTSVPRPHPDVEPQLQMGLLSPGEVFYTDPTTSPGQRIPNAVRDASVFNCLQLHIPPPVSSACLAPPQPPDPLTLVTRSRSRLGFPNSSSKPLFLSEMHQAGDKLSPEEDQVIVILLALHLLEPGLSHEALHAAQMESPNVSTSAEDVCAVLQNHLVQGKIWSEKELEAADTLLCITVSNPPPNQHHQDLANNTDQEPETATQNGSGCVRFSHVREKGEPRRGTHWPDEERKVSEVFPGAKDLVLSDLEEIAVRVLLGFRNARPFNILQ